MRVKKALLIFFSLGLILGFFCATKTSQAQGSKDSLYYQHLYYLGKTWGHVKYRHSQFTSRSVNWDLELLTSLKKINASTNNKTFNQEVLGMLNQAGTMARGTGSLPTIEDSLNNILDSTWMTDSILIDSVQNILLDISVNFRPQNNQYILRNVGTGHPNFNQDSAYYYLPEYPNLEYRLLALYRYWNIINYLYPYKKIMDQNWDSTLLEIIPYMVKAKDRFEYMLALKRLFSRIDDTHASMYNRTYGEWRGSYFAPFLAQYLDSQLVITKVHPNVTTLFPGDVITEVDGISISQWKDSLRPLVNASNEAVAWREMISLISLDPNKSATVRILDSGQYRVETVNRVLYTEYLKMRNSSKDVWWDTTLANGCKVGVVDMGKLEKEDVDDLFLNLGKTDAQIFDVRNYPKGSLWNLVDYLYRSPIHIANFTVPDYTYPGRLYWKKTTIGNGTNNPYRGKLFILFDERTQSHAEYTCMGLEQFPGAVKIGSRTSAADGNVSRIYLPGNVYTSATFLGTYYPDYTPTQRVGIVPDIYVRPTISGLKNGEDELLNRAFAEVSCFPSQIDKLSVEEVGLKMYPNPASNSVNYEVLLGSEQNDEPFHWVAFDALGKQVHEFYSTLPQGQLDLSSWPSGIYTIQAGRSTQHYTIRLVVH